MIMRFASVVMAAVLLGPLAAPVLRAQDEPVTAGSGGVSVPKRAKTVSPEYPPAAPQSFPQAARGPAPVVAEVSLDPDGGGAEPKVARGEAPWANALRAALRTWRFAAEAGEATVSFRVRADFVPGERKDPPKVR